MFTEICTFLAWHADDWLNASNGSRIGTLIGGAALMAIAAGLCAL